MEDIKSNFDIMLAKFNESVTHSAPKKLVFDKFSNSFDLTDAVPKKRRRSPSVEALNLNGSENPNESKTSLNSSIAVPPSPWETRRLKADIIEANSRIASLKQEIQRQHKIREEVETLANSKLSELMKQCQFSADKVVDVENHLVQVRKREQFAKHNLLKLEKEYNQQKHIYEETIQKLRSAKKEIEEDAREVQNCLENELSEFRRHSDKLEMELEFATEELANVKKQLDGYKIRAAAYDELKAKHEKTEQCLDTANSRIKQLEFEISSYADWKEITKKSQTRLINLPDLEHEVERLRTSNKHLHELLGNKLLLEEQVHSYKERLQKEEGARKEMIALQVKFSHMEEELKQWVLVAQDHCPPNMLVSPFALRARIEQLLQNDILAVSEKSTKLSETKSIETELLDCKKQCDIYAKNIEELNTALKRHKNFRERVQKKLLLVSKERDCYKQLLDNFENDLTVSTVTPTEITPTEKQLRTRVDMLEKTLTGYKEMCASLEKKIESVGSTQQSTTELSPENEHFKRELDTLRKENDRLRRRKEDLELELEHRCLKGDFNINKYKVVHMSKNPANEAYENTKNIIEKLQAEIERLKRRNHKLEEDAESTQTRQNDTSNMTMNIKELNQLRSEIDSANAKMRKIKECYKSANMEFREVCYMLFGYRIDRVGLNTNYKLSSMYAESPDDYLNFRLNEANVVEMLETPYSATLKSLIETQLVGNKSLPAFLSALTLDLFQRATITIS